MRATFSSVLFALIVVAVAGFVYVQSDVLLFEAEIAAVKRVDASSSLAEEPSGKPEMPRRLGSKVEAAFGAEAVAFVDSMTPAERVSAWCLVDDPDRARAVKRLASRFGFERAIPFLLNLEPGFANRNFQRSDGMKDVGEKAVLDLIVTQALKLSPPEVEFLAKYPEFTRVYLLAPKACHDYLAKSPEAGNLEAAWVLCSEAASNQEIEATLSFAQQRGTRMRLVEQLCAAPIDDEKFAIAAALLRARSDEEVSELANLDEDERLAILLCAVDVTSSSYGLSEEDRLWAARQVLMKPEQGRLLCVVLAVYQALDEKNRALGRSTHLTDKVIAAYRSVDALALVSCYAYRHNPDFHTVLERDNPLATALITAAIEISEEGDITSYEHADDELAKILDRGDLYLGDFELNEEGLPAEKLSVTVRELVPGGDAYQLIKLTANGASPSWTEIGLGVLDGTLLAVDVFAVVGTAGLAGPALAAAKAAMTKSIRGVLRWSAKNLPRVVNNVRKLGRASARAGRLLARPLRSTLSLAAPKGSFVRRALDFKSIAMRWIRTSPTRSLLASLASDVALGLALNEGFSQYSSFRRHGSAAGPLSWALERDVPVNRDLVRSELHRYYIETMTPAGEGK